MLRDGSLVRQATIRRGKVAPLAPRASLSPGSGAEDAAELEWLRELPDELDECLAQRDFDNVLELLAEGARVYL